MAALVPNAWAAGGRAAPRVGILDTFADNKSEATLRGHAVALGFSQSDALRIERVESPQSAEGALIAARRLVALRPDAIVAYGDIAARAAQAATSTIDIVAMSYDLIGAGLVSSLRAPGRNLTGVSLMSDELNAKRLEMLAELLPPRSTILLLGSTTSLSRTAESMSQAASRLGVKVLHAPIDAWQDVAPTIEGARGRGAVALQMLYSDLLVVEQNLVAQLAAKYRLPLMQALPSIADYGEGMIGYGPDMDMAERQLTRVLLSVLGGARAGTVPVEQPTHFSLSINLQVAQRLGITVPKTMQALADRLWR